MSDDTETFKKLSSKRSHRDEYDGHDFPSMTTDMFFGINWKVAFFLYIIMVFVLSDTYIELVLNNIKTNMSRYPIFKLRCFILYYTIL